MIAIIEVCYLFLSKNGEEFSRISFVVFYISGIFLVYIERILWKRYLLHYNKNFAKKRKIIAVFSSEDAKKLLEQAIEKPYKEWEIVGIVLADREDMVGQNILGIPVVCKANEIPDYIQTKWIDSIWIHLPRKYQLPLDLVNTCIEMGVAVHNTLVNVNTYAGTKEVRKIGSYHVLTASINMATPLQLLVKRSMDICGGNTLVNVNTYAGTKEVRKIGSYHVLTASINMATPLQLLVKRSMDICGGFVGLLFTGIATLFLAPAIYIASPGPIFFSQVRIGKNGRKFKIYKFRSMYMDAEERKKELMSRNEMQGLMFKMDADPRIIGSGPDGTRKGLGWFIMYMDAEERKKELMSRNEMQGLMFKMDADPRIIGSGPDGTRKGLGWFIRKTSLDEFPQFWNVLKGDMSLVGTRPPTVDEWNQYDYHHRARMAIKPGITGMWQVSGRSDITDFEEVVRLDREYIEHWNIGLDLKILLKTVLVVFKGAGSK